MIFEPNTLLNQRYRLETPLGGGAMGTVYRARDEQNGRLVAVKVLRPQLAASAALAARFEREAALLARLRHAHIVAYVDFGRTADSLFFLVMEYVAGTTLHVHLARHGMLVPNEAAAMLTPIAAALDAVHAAGLVHRDLKPSNVLLDADQAPYLVDFGVAKEAASELTQTGVTLGTYAYMAPEQLVNAKTVTGAADIYALGVMAYELLTGRLPFIGGSAEMIDGHRFQPPPPPSRFNPALSAAVESVVLRALVKDPTQRFASAGAMAEGLQQALRDDFVTLVPQTAVFPTTLIATPNNLPAPLTALIGRDAERQELAALLRDPQTRLVTLTGPGGIGKTQLSLDAARAALPAFPDGVFLVELGPVQQPSLVLSAVAQALGVREDAGQSLEAALAAWLRPKRLLLLLDNFEHLLDAAVDVTRLLEAAPQLTVLATSRAPLQIRGEQEYPLAPLAQADAVALFMRRAQAIRPSFEVDEHVTAVEHIVDRLDRLPLAIDLAAPRLRLFTPAQLLARLDDRLGLLRTTARDVPDRQRTLEATIDWSYQLLTPAEQALFRRLSVFSGSSSLEAIEIVCHHAEDLLAGDLLYYLESLVAKNLVQQQVVMGLNQEEELRIVLLETIHAFAHLKLAESNESFHYQARHADYYLKFAQSHDPMGGGQNQRHVLEAFDREHGNLRAALRWALVSDNIRMALKLADDLHPFWMIRSHLSEARRCHDEIASRLTGLQLGEQARALYLAGNTAIMVNDLPSAKRQLEACLALAEKYALTADQANALRGLGEIALKAHDFSAAQEKLLQALALRESAAEERGIAASLTNLGHIARYQGHLDEAKRNYARSLEIFEKLGDYVNMAHSVNSLGNVARDQGAYEEARQHYKQSLTIQNDLGSQWGIAAAYNNLGEIAILTGDYGQAAALIDETLKIFRRLDDRLYLAYSLLNRGTVAEQLEDFQAAQGYYEESLAIQRTLEDQWGIAAALGNLGGIALRRGNRAQAVRLMREGVSLFAGLNYRHESANVLFDFANAIYLNGRKRQALQLFGALSSLRETMNIAVTPGDQTLYDQNLADARATFTVDEFEALWHAGRQMSLEAATEYAIKMTADLSNGASDS
jgi:predicted ATPase